MIVFWGLDPFLGQGASRVGRFSKHDLFPEVMVFLDWLCVSRLGVAFPWDEGLGHKSLAEDAVRTHALVVSSGRCGVQGRGADERCE